MLDNFREWLSDNLRYILLGLAILLALVLLFFGVKALTGGFSDEKPKDTEKKTEQRKIPQIPMKQRKTMRIRKMRMLLKRMHTLK